MDFKKPLTKGKGRMKITELTEEQKSKFPDYVKKWTDIGLSTERSDRPKTEEIIKKIYKNAGFGEPKIVWSESPIGNFKALAEMLKQEPGNENKTVDEILKEEYRENAYHCMYGYHDADWLSFYDYFRNECNLVEETEPLVNLIELSKHCGWLLPFEYVCFVSERNIKLNRDTQGRLHSETEAAIEYADGYKIYAIHGVRVPGYIIENPELITIEKINQENNVEIRRIMIQRYKGGLEAYMRDSNAVVIDEQPDIHTGLPVKLWKAERKDDTPIVIVQMFNKTQEPDDHGNMINKLYYIRVKPDITDAIGAIAWHHNQSKQEYLSTQKGT